MLKNSTKCLYFLLAIISIVSTINVIIIYWIPIIIPLSSISVLRLTVVAFIEKKHYLIAISMLICVLLFLSTTSIRRQHIILPILSLVYLIYDFVTVFSFFVDGLEDGYWKMYIVQILILLILIVLLSIYCWNYFNKKRQNSIKKVEKTGDGNLIDE